jgi:phosphatidate cytidylyltransferase
MVKQRVFTAFVIAIVLAWIFKQVHLGEVDYFQKFLVLLLGFSALEWAKLSHVSHQFTRGLYAVINILILYFCVSYFQLIDMTDQSVLLVTHFFEISVSIWAIFLLWVITYPKSTLVWRSTFVRLIMGIVTMVSFYLGLFFLVNIEHGIYLISYLICLVAISDTGAFFVGRSMGRHKLAINVSPGKTIEGFIGGVLFSVLFTCLAWSFGFHFGFELFNYIIVSIVLSMIGVVGDLFESMLKRHRGIKDSGWILPGHGGLLDRLDSHMAVIPLFCLMYISFGLVNV